MTTRLFVGLIAGLAVSSTSAHAGEFGPSGPTRIDFESSDIPTGSLADGLQVGDLTFSFGFPVGRGTNPNASVGFFPVGTPHTGGKGIEGPTSGILGLTFARPVRSLAFGFALQGSNFFGDGSVLNGVTVELFDPEGGFIGSFTQDADPVMFDDRGGGAEYASARFATGGMRIGSASVTFPSEQTPVPPLLRSNAPIDRFFFDNVSFDLDVIPLPTPALLGAAGLAGLGMVRRRRFM
jgi:hypothetical protein